MHSRVGPQVGAGLEYGIIRNLAAATFSYDDLENGFSGASHYLWRHVTAHDSKFIVAVC